MARRGPRGLRARLMLAVGAVVITTVAAAFAVVYHQTDGQLRSRVDSQVSGSARELARSMRSAAGGTAGAALSSARAYVHDQPYQDAAVLLFAVVPGQGTVSNHPEIVTSSRPDDDETPAEQERENAEAARIRALGPGFNVVHDSDIGQLRLYKLAFTIGGVRIEAGAAEPLSGLDHALDGVAKSFLLAGGLALLLAVAFAYLIGTRISAPLRSTAAVAARIDGGDLSPRLEPPANASAELLVLTEAFNRMLDRLAAAFDGQRAFIADASHELRTPLTVIRGQLDLLAAGAQDAVAGDAGPVAAEEILRVEQLVQAEIGRVTRLTDDLLVLAQAEQADFLHLESFELREFIFDLWDGLSLTAERDFEVAPVPDVTLRADPDRLAQALRNLAVNAVHHTQAPDGLVRIEASVDGAQTVSIAVSDDGPGIPEAQRARVFERFFRTDPARSRARGGAGLGLAIVAAVAEAHGGRVEVGESAAGGARFTIELPLVPPER